MSWFDFWKNMDRAEKEAFSIVCGSTYVSMRNNYLYSAKIPRPGVLAKMVRESNGKLELDKAVEHFYTSKVRAEIQRLQKEENPENGV